MILYTLLFIGCAWLLQSFLGFWQIKNFNRHYRELRALGKVAIGRSKGRVRTGVVLLLAIDEKCRITKAMKMQGITVFARFRPLPIMEGQHLLRIEESVLERLDRFTRKAVDDAIYVYKTVSSGKEVPVNKSPLEKLFSLSKAR